MSDDFDRNDDLPWLPKDDDDQPDEQPEDDAGLDWQKGKSGKAGGKPGRTPTGLTGELSWLQGDEKSADSGAAGGDDLSFDWQADQPDESQLKRGQRTGLTGELPWMQGLEDQPDAELDSAEPFGGAPQFDDDAVSSLGSAADLPPWMRDSDAEFDDEAAFESLSGSEEPEEEPPAAADIPEWLKSADIENEEQPAARRKPQAELPDWMQTGDDAEFEEEPSAEENLPDWLQSGDDEPLEGEEEFPEQPVSGEETPAWLSQADEEEAAAPAELPPWLAGMAPEVEAEETAPVSAADWLAQAGDVSEVDFGTEEPAEEIPDLFAEIEQEAEPVPEAEPEFTGFDDMDFEDMFAEPEAAAPGEEQPSFDDLFGDVPPAAGTGEEEPAFEDLFGDLSGESAEASFEDLFGDLRAKPSGEFEDVPSPGDLLEEQPAAASSSADFDDEAAFEALFGDEEAEPIPLGEDFMRDMGIEKPVEEGDESFDWFAEAEAAKAPADDLGWLEEIGDAGQEEGEEFEEAPLPPDEDFLSALEALRTDQPAVPEPEVDVDRYLSSFDAEKIELPKTDELNLATNAEFESLFSEATFKEIEDKSKSRRPTSKRPNAPDAPEWLADISVGEESAAALVRKRKDRPLEDLPERLQELHERGLELPAPAVEPQPGGVLASVLPGVKDVLSPAPIEPGEPVITGGMQLTPEQRERARLLKSLAGIQEGLGLPGVDAKSLEFDWAQDVPAPEARPKPAAPARARRRGRIKVDRVLLVLLLAAVMIAPFFVRGLRLGDLPPRSFAANSRQQAAFNLVDNLEYGQYVLVGIEYGPTATGELDDTTEALLRHILLRGGRPVLLGGNAVGLLHAGNILNRIGGDQAFLLELGRNTAFVANSDYYLIRYLTGNMVGLRALGQDMAALLRTDIYGTPTGLEVDSPDDFGLIIIIAERAEDVRIWAEQVLPLSRTPLIVATGFSAAPLSEPYVGKSSAMLVGYRDAYTYSAMLNVTLYGEIVEPTVPPTTPPPTAVLPTATLEATSVKAEVTAEATEEAGTPTTRVAPTLPPEFTATFTASPTFTPSPTPTPTLTATPTVTPSPTPTNTFTPSPTPLPVAVVTSPQSVNVRSGPGTNFQPITALRPGSEMRVIGQSDDGQWLNILLDDGQQGWINAALVEIQTPSENATPTPQGSAFNGKPAQDKPLFSLFLQTTPQGLELTASAALTDAPGLQETANAALTQAPAGLRETANAALTQVPGVDLTLTAISAPSSLDATLQSLSLTMTAVVTPEARATAEVQTTPETTPEATTEAVISADSEAATTTARSEIPYRNERWYSMTLGLAFVVVMIALGNLFNIVRYLSRRGRS